MSNMKYAGNVLEAFSAGAVTDLRFRFAMDLLKAMVSSTFFDATMGKDLARQSFEIVDFMFAEGESRCWVKEITDSGELPAALRHHIERTARAQVHGQFSGQKAMSEMQPKVAPVNGGFPLMPNQ